MATEVVADAQVTWLVRFCVELSENVPVAVNCWLAPAVMLGLTGVTAIDCRVTAAALTVSAVEPVTPLSDAVMVDVPADTPVASPAVLIVATDAVADAQVTWLVRFCVELSENVPVAVNCWLAPAVTLGFAGVTAIDCRVATPVDPEDETMIVPDIPPAVPFP